MSDDSSQWGSTSTMAAESRTTQFAATTYPVSLDIATQPHYSRFFAIPVLGYMARAIMLIPHVIVLYVLSIVAAIVSLVAWIPVLATGRYPKVGYQMCGGTLQYGMRVYAYMFGLTDVYPPFALATGGSDYAVNVTIQEAEHSSRLFAIPVIGYVARMVMLIPHLIVLYVLFAVVAILQLVTWAFVLGTGQYPEWARSLVVGLMRWWVRVGAFFLGLTDAYPPFRLGD